MRVDKNRENSGEKKKKDIFDRNWNGNAGNVDCPGKEVIDQADCLIGAKADAGMCKADSSW